MAKQERAIATREAIIQAGARLFGSKHYESIRITALLEEAGVTQGGFYFHFKDGKKAVAEELIRRQEESFQQMRDEVIADTESDGLTALFTLGRILAGQLRDDAVARAGMRLVIQASEHFPDLAQISRPSWLEAVKAILTRGRDDGSLRSDVDVDAAARAVVFLFFGTQASSYIDNDWERIEDDLEASITFAAASLTRPGQSRVRS